MRSSQNCQGATQQVHPLAQFDHFVRQFFNEGQQQRGWEPKTAIWEEGNRTVVELDLPGVVKEDVDISVEKGFLKISGTRKAAEGRTYRYNDRRQGEFAQTYRLPETVDADSVQAELSGGVLVVSLTNKPEAQGRKIEVKSS